MNFYSKSICFLFIVILLSMTLIAKAGEPLITGYDIKVTVPSSFECFQIETKVEISSAGYNQEFFLCKDFRGAILKNVKVLDNSGNILQGTFENNILKVFIPEDIRKPDKTALFINYQLFLDKKNSDDYSVFAFNISPDDCHINSSITRTDNWFPKLENMKRLPPFILSVDIPSGFEVMASGKLYFISENQGRKIFKWKNYEEITDRGLYFFARKCDKLSKTYSDGFRIDFYLPSNSIEENVDYIGDIIYKSYRFYEDKFGKTGLSEYKVMAEPFGYSGLFNSMTLGDEFFTKKIENNEILFPSRFIAHEVSHTWWGNIIAPEAGKEYWLFEGFAKFSEIIALKTVFDKDVEGESFRRLKSFYLPYYNYDLPLADAGKIENRDLQVAVAYYKGALFLKSLELLMGEEAFFNGIKDYVKSNRGKSVNTEDFKNSMKKATTEKLDNIFNNYYRDKGLAEYTVSVLESRKEHDCYITKFKIENNSDKDIYTVMGVKTYLDNYTKKVYIPKNSVFFVEVKNTEPSGIHAVNMDINNSFLLCEKGLIGPGGYVYFDTKGNCIFTGIIENGPLGKSGVQNGMTLLEIGGVKVSSMGLLEVNKKFMEPADTRINVKVQYNGENIKDIEVLLK